MVTIDQLVSAVPTVSKVKASNFLSPLNAAMKEFGIDQTRKREAMFLAQVFHESGCLKYVEENLNYSAEALQRVWPSRFDVNTAAAYARNPEKIANKVYANRMGNGDEASGDGWKHRGAGLIQLTGKDNQYACATALGVSNDLVGEWLKTEVGASRSAAWFWNRAGLSSYADKGDFDSVCDLINLGHKTDKVGDSIGYADRLSLYQSFSKILGVV